MANGGHSSKPRVSFNMQAAGSVLQASNQGRIFAEVLRTTRMTPVKGALRAGGQSGLVAAFQIRRGAFYSKVGFASLIMS
jgi:hypothetical protein